MKWLDNLSLRSKLIVNFVVAGGVFVIAILTSLQHIDRLAETSRRISGNWLTSAAQSERISRERLRYRVRSLEYLLGTPAERPKFAASLGKLDASLREAIGDYRARVSSPEERAMIDAVESRAARYRDAVERAVALVSAGREDEAQALRRTEWVAAADDLRDQVAALLKYNVSHAAADAQRAEAAIGEAKVWGYGALAVGTVVAMLACWLIARRMAEQLAGALAAAQRIAGGDLTGALPTASRDEIGRLAAAVGRMQGALQETIRQNRHSAGEVSGAARELGAGLARMQGSVAVQSAAAAAIAANVEELTVSIAHVTETTGDASRLAQDADRQARAGRQAVTQLVDEINVVAEVVAAASQRIAGLEAESQRISEIVGVIKDIAEQTNLLALNAAIEAARAGEHGRGFAVVADEVRKLSERTSHSTGEITGMVSSIQHATREVVGGIDQGVAAVGKSVDHAREAGDTIASLQDIARRVAELVGEVDLALREQSTASAEVAKRVEEVATQTEQTGAATTGAVHSAEALNRVAAALQGVVERFRV